MSVTITSFVPAYAGGAVTTGTLILNAPNQGVNGQLAMLFMNPGELLIGTGTNMFSVETMADILSGTHAPGYSYNDLALPTASLDFNSQLLTNVLDPTGLQDAATKNYVDTQLGLIGGPFLKTDGTNSMTGALNIDTNPITLDNDLDTYIVSSVDDVVDLWVGGAHVLSVDAGQVDNKNRTIVNVLDPVSDQHVATKKYVDDAIGASGPYLPLSGVSAMTGDLDMGAQDITNVVLVDGRDVDVDGTTLDTHVADATIHFVINDAGTALDEAWSSDKINTELGLKLDSATAATTYLPVSGAGAMAGNLDMGGFLVFNMSSPTLAGDSANKGYVDTQITALGLVGVGPYLPLAGGTMTGTLALNADPTFALEAATKSYVDTEITNLGLTGPGPFLALTGGTMTGAIDMGTNLINNVVDPSGLQDAATKNYVDTEIVALSLNGTGPYVRLSGADTMVGALDMGTNQINSVVDPTLAQDAATKGYVDTEIVSLGLGGATGPFLRLSGADTMSGNLDMGGNDITNVGSMTIGDHIFGANDYQSNLGGDSFLIRLTASPSVITPTYSFASDPNSGILTNGAGTITVASGGTAHFSVSSSSVDAHSKQVKNVLDPTADQDAATKAYVDGMNSTRLLAKATGVDLTTATTTGLYTVPAGKMHVITDVIIRLTSFVPGGAPTGPTFNVGTAAAFNQIVNGFSMTLTPSNAADQAWYASRDASFVQGAETPNAGSGVVFNITSGAGGTISAAVADVYVIGFEA